MTSSKSPSRVDVGGFAVLIALIISSSAAYAWPRITTQFDPFRLSGTSLLGLVAITMFCLGLVVRTEELEELRKRPLSVLFGVLIQCTVMPAMSLLIVITLSLDGAIAYGVLLAGCVPGAMASNVLTMTARGNVSYSVSLTTVATLISPITVPLALLIVSGSETGWDVFKPVRTAIILLCTVVVPVILGQVLKRNSELLRRSGGPIAQAISTITLLWIIASVVAGNRDRLALVSGSLLGGLLLMNLGGYLGGFLCGKAARLPAAMNRALTLEVGMQNAGLGTVLAANLMGANSEAQIPTAAYTFGCMFTGTLLAAAFASVRDQPPAT